VINALTHRPLDSEVRGRCQGRREAVQDVRPMCPVRAWVGWSGTYSRTVIKWPQPPLLLSA